MKKIIFLLVCSLSFLSCSVQQIPLKGTYLDEPYQMIVDKPFDEVWSNLIDLFATKGLSIKVIDRSSGLLVSEKTSFTNNFTTERENGSLINPSAYLVTEYKKGPNGIIKPTAITAEWNVRLKKVGENSTSINVNLTNINATKVYPPSRNSPGMTLYFEGKSTGVFENMISGLIK